MKVYQIILNEAGVEPIAGRPGSYRVVYPPEYNMPPEGPLSKYEAEKKLQDAELKFRNKRAQDYLDKKEIEKQQQEKKGKDKSSTQQSKPLSPEEPSTRQSKPPPPMPEDAGKTRAPKQDWWDKAAARWKNTAEYDAYVQKRVPKWIGRLSWGTMWMLRYFNLLEPLYMMYADLARAEKAYMDEQYPYNHYERYREQGSDVTREQSDKADMERYNQDRNYIVGEFMAKYGVILVLQSLRMLIQWLVWGKLIKNIFLYLSAPATFGASIIGAVGSEVAIGATIAFLESKEGKEWWQKKVRSEVILLGQIGDSGWQTLRTGILAFARQPALTSQEAVNEKRKQYREPESYPPELEPNDSKSDKTTSNVEKDSKGQGTQNNTGKNTGEKIPVPPKRLPKLPPASQSKVKFPSDVRSWINGGWNINGEPVTDGDGFLIPGIEHDIRVRVARRWAKEHGYPDPLADLPAAPGQQHPGPFVD